MKTSTTIALALATMLSSPLAAYAQTEQPMIHHHDHVRHYDGPHHIVHHHYGAHNPAPGPAPMAQRPGKPVESGPPQTNPMFKPYANPGDGDDDGLSRDPDDCNKGCVGGNPG